MATDTLLDVLIFTPERIVYQGKASQVMLPGEKGVFEVLPFHKKLLSRLIRGYLIVDGRHLAIRRGVAKVGDNQVVIVAEELIGGG